VYSGETDCQWGCLGYGDCFDVCEFDAIELRAHLGVPLIIDENCVACCKAVNALLGSMSLKEKIQVVLNQQGQFKCPNLVIQRCLSPCRFVDGT